MSSSDDQLKPKNRMALWKRLVLVGFSVGGGLVLVGLIIGLSISWYNNRPLPVHEWPQIDINSYGLKARLKTRWRNNSLYYTFVLSPSSQSKVKAFDTAIRNYRGLMLLTVHFYDRSGFQLCSNSITGSDTSQEIDDAGEIDGLSANGSWWNCSRDRYVGADKWNLSWNTLPNISAETEKTAPDVRTSAKHEAQQANASYRGDTLSGIDILKGELDMESGRVFSVYESGEKDTIIGWRAGEHVESSCGPHSNCLVKDTANGEKVHAHLIK